MKTSFNELLTGTPERQRPTEQKTLKLAPLLSCIQLSRLQWFLPELQPKWVAVTGLELSCKNIVNNLALILCYLNSLAASQQIGMVGHSRTILETTDGHTFLHELQPFFENEDPHKWKSGTGLAVAWVLHATENQGHPFYKKEVRQSHEMQRVVHECLYGYMCTSRSGQMHFQQREGGKAYPNAKLENERTDPANKCRPSVMSKRSVKIDWVAVEELK